MNDILTTLNPDQHAAVTADDGPVLVVAGAGSGKTRVLTTRIAWLLRERGVSPGQVLAFTFTNKAAREMRERVGAALGEDRAPWWIGTFHATGLRILRADGQHIGVKANFSIYDSDDSLRLVKAAVAELKLDPKQFQPASLRAMLSTWKNEDRPPDQALAGAGSFVEEKAAAVYRVYEKSLVDCNALDFDDLILRTVHLLEQVAEVREKYADRFRHVLVDEFQDTNKLQLVLCKLLSSRHGNLFVVGDDDQSIYSWRGARVENMLRFDEFFPGTRTFRLEQNYRSCGNILAAANAVIACNKQRKGKNLWTSEDDGEPLRVEEYLDGEDEAARLAAVIQAEEARGATRGDVTVLYRTNAQSRLLEDALRRATIPYQIVGGLHFYDRREVRDLLAYLKLVANPSDQISALRAINVPKRKIGKTTCTRLQRLAAAEELTLGEAAARENLLERELAPAACRRVRDFFDQMTRWRAGASGLPVPDLLERILEQTDYFRFLEDDDRASAATRKENVAELVNATHAFHEQSGGGTLDQYLEQVALIADPDTIREGEGVVRLMTIHTAKGLEFPVVILTGCEDELLPHVSSSAEDAGLEEERRLFYVALTRARRRIYLLHATRRRRFGAYESSLPSRFLAELPDDLVRRTRQPSSYQQPVASTLFGSGRQGSSTRAAYRAPRTQASTSKPVRPEDWLARNRKPKPAADWDADVSQVDQSPYFEGQTVSHGTFGAGVVVRVEGYGDDLKVTVDFHEAGRKHLLPRFAPLVPID